MTPCSEFHKVLFVGWVAVVGVVFVGCQKSPPAHFRLNMVEMAEKEMTEENQQTIANVLEAMFGTPDEPFVLPETNLDIKKLQIAAGPVQSDRTGRHRGLFREHCVHCHGISGDGMGPTASFLKPYPRDYRQGKFKFTSTPTGAMPTDDDLERIIRNGVPGTAMPPFEVALAQPEIDALVEYVKYLSLRGRVEIALVMQILDLNIGEELPTDRETLVEMVLLPEVEKWQSAKESVIQPEAEPPEDFGTLASIDKGRELFFSEKKGNCVLCHGTTGLGDGQRTNYDEWSKQVHDLRQSALTTLNRREEMIANFETRGEEIQENDELSAAERREKSDALEEEREQALADLDEAEEKARWKLALLEAHALEPRTIDPRNLRLGVYRGGRRPIDIFYRLQAGINGSGMPAAPLTPEEKWHVIDYVLSLPYEPGGELGVDRVMAARERN
jgi:mono/diheme cytochrome c family protein